MSFTPSAPAGSPAPSAPTSGGSSGATSPGGTGSTLPGTPKAPVSPSGAARGAATPQGTPNIQGQPGQAGQAKPADKHIFNRTLPDGTVEPVDISDYKFKIKVNGEEREMGIQEAYKVSQLERASMAKFSEADKLMKAAEARQASLENVKKVLHNPEAVQKHLKELINRTPGGSEKWEQFLVQEIRSLQEWKKLPPEERQRREAMTKQEREYQERMRQVTQKEKYFKEREAQEAKAKTQKQMRDLESRWPTQIQSLGVPNDPIIIRDIMKETAGLLLQARKSNYSMTDMEAMKLAINAVKQKTTGIISKADPTALRAFLGDDTVSRISQAHVSKINQQPGRLDPNAPPPEPTPSKDQPVVRFSDIRKNMGR